MRNNRVVVRLSFPKNCAIGLLLAFIVFGVIGAPAIWAQSAQSTAAPHPTFDAFEVATIKSTPPDWHGGRFIRMESAHQFVARNHTLKTLVQAAYNLNPRAISGGAPWIDSDHYDILAKTPGDVRPNLEEQMSMLRNLLAERFKLTLHREQKELAHYALTVAKSGPKLKESTVSPDASPEGPPPLIFVVALPVIRLPGRYATMAELASVMQRAALDRPVVDQTGLSGRYDFDLEFVPDESQFGGMLGKVAGADDSAKPGLFAALQEQLGLRLEAVKGPIEALVIDRVEKPSEN
jgi:uncharacterized protein (TIGR03435 family)